VEPGTSPSLVRYMPFMKLSSILTITGILIARISVFGQTEELSKHQFSFYINDKEMSAPNAEILVVVCGDTIKGKYSEGFYYFPAIDTSKDFEIIVKLKDIVFSGQG
jgi:hypothetical protein